MATPLGGARLDRIRQITNDMGAAFEPIYVFADAYSNHSDRRLAIEIVTSAGMRDHGSDNIIKGFWLWPNDNAYAAQFDQTVMNVNLDVQKRILGGSLSGGAS